VNISSNAGLVFLVFYYTIDLTSPNQDKINIRLTSLLFVSHTSS
jgi:hypothetical protein